MLNLIDGTVWIFGPMMIITMFFGFKPVCNDKVIRHMCLILFGYEVISAIIFAVGLHIGKSYGVCNWIASAFGIAYWTMNTPNIRKIKAFFIALIATDITGITVLVLSNMSSFVCKEIWHNSIVLKIALLVSPLLWDFVIFFFSKLSCRKRNEPMAMSLIVILLFVFMLADSFMEHFHFYERLDFQNLVFLRVLIDVKLDESSMTVGVFVTLLFILMLSVLMIIKESEASYFRKKHLIDEYYLEAQKKHYESLIETNREIRKIKHDMKNHLYVISKLASESNLEELTSYLIDLEERFSHVDIQVQVGNEIADAIISEKQRKASEQGIELKVEGDMRGIDFPAIDICTIFSNLIDNAIEAVSKEHERKWIHLVLKRHNNFLVITECNPCKDRIDIVDNHILSTKLDRGNHGFGLINIKETVEKYDGDVKLSVDAAENGCEFTIEIIVTT